MQPIQNYEIEISKLINQFENIDKYKDSESRELFQNTEKTIESKLFDIIKNNFTDKLSTEFLDLVNKNFYSYRNGTVQGRVCWKLFSKINSYIHANSSDEKNTRLKEVEDLMKKTERQYVLNKGFTQAIYLSQVPDILDLYKTIFPKPPLSIFDADKIPPSLIKENEEKNRIIHQNSKTAIFKITP